MRFHPNEINRRGLAASYMILGVLGFLLIGFFRSQVLQHQKYVLQSETNRLREIPLPAPRGVIYDRNGEVMAANVIGYTVSGAVPREVGYGLVFINPLSFMLLMLVDLRQRVRIMALVFGLAAGPVLHLFSPTWGLLIAGFCAGTAAFLADRWLPAPRRAPP